MEFKVGDRIVMLGNEYVEVCDQESSMMLGGAEGPFWIASVPGDEWEIVSITESDIEVYDETRYLYQCMNPTNLELSFEKVENH